MKKLLSFCVGFLATICTYAQDYIVTIDGQTINAKITEVSKTEIRYKELDNLDGPTFVLPIDDIKSITYSNGKIVKYAKEVEEQTVSKNDITIREENPLDTIFMRNGEQKIVQVVNVSQDGVTYEAHGETLFVKSEDAEKIHFSNGRQITLYNKQKKLLSQKSNSVINEKTDENSVSQPSIKTGTSRIYREGKEYMYNDTYISGKEVKRILQNQDPLAYEQWRKGDGLVIGASVCAGVGLGLAIGGIFPIIWGDYGVAIGVECSALVPLGVGLGLALGAGAKYNKAIDIYNSKYDNAAIQLNIFTSPTGVGLALSF